MTNLGQGTNETATRPHPMAGRLAVAPIPASLESKDAANGTVFGMLGYSIEVGHMAGIVLEIGEMPERLRDHEEYLTPYGLGATVFYQEAQAIKLKGWHFVPMGAIVAWESGQ